MNYQEFLIWLESERNMSIRSARDVVSRLRRVVRLLGSDSLDITSLSELSEVDSFNNCSMFIKSQLRRSVNLYLEYANKK